jgi:D-arabinose 1-dehydrogenase-like Zn-dependent alcohol dehydrogenase
MASTYRAVEISSPGVFSLVERKVTVLGAGQVRIRVEACGVCHSDAATVEAQFPNLSYPRVPGHEVIGRIEEVGPGVTAWKVDQRVGVGFFGGEDGTCETCCRGDTAYCQNPIITGVTSDGGYAEMMIAEARALALIPEELKSEDAAPLVCAGITTFNALRNTGRAGDTVAIQGIGGLGHLGVQYAKKMGFRTVAIGFGPDKEHLAPKLGAHIYIDAKAEDARVLKKLAEELGLKKLNFQVLRRTTATLAQRMGTVKDLQAIMAHSKPDTTAGVYMQPIEESVKQTLDAIYAELTRRPKLKKVS